MAKHEGSASAASANRIRGWRPLAVFAALALAACSGGGRSTGSFTEAQHELTPGGPAAPSQGPFEERVVVDCQQNPRARHSVEEIGHEAVPSRVGSTWIVGLINEKAPVTAGGKPPVIAGIKLVYRGGHMYSAETLDSSNPGSAEVSTFNSTNPAAEVSYTHGNARFTVETVPEPMYGRPHKLGIIATVDCAGAAPTNPSPAPSN